MASPLTSSGMKKSMCKRNAGRVLWVDVRSRHSAFHGALAGRRARKGSFAPPPFTREAREFASQVASASSSWMGLTSLMMSA